MALIQSLTVTYEMVEDRIQLAMLLEDGAALRLWLTQRLARKLVRALTDHMEKAEAIPLSIVRNAVMTEHQVEAISTFRPSKPVKVEQGQTGYLVTDITLNLSPTHLQLIFISGAQVKPSIILDQTLARQWLSMLHRQFLTAAWPEDIWPNWVVEGRLDPGAEATRH